MPFQGLDKPAAEHFVIIGDQNTYHRPSHLILSRMRFVDNNQLRFGLYELFSSIGAKKRRSQAHPEAWSNSLWKAVSGPRCFIKIRVFACSGARVAQEVIGFESFG